MKLDIPDNLYFTFKEYLDVTQAFFTEEAVARMTGPEKELFAWIGKLLGKDLTPRFKTNKQFKDAHEKAKKTHY